MEFLKLLSKKSGNLKSEKTPTIAFIGDSVTQGCFELYITESGKIETVFDSKHGYHHILEDILSMLYPNVPVNYIYAGISGDTAEGGLMRLERDVLSHHPNLTVVSFGLNDSNRGTGGISSYCESLRQIFNRLKAIDSEVIFMTENMMNTYVNYNQLKKPFSDVAEKAMKLQNDGILNGYFEAAKQTAQECNVHICDVYSKWKTLYEHGVDINHLLSNSINHPIRPMHSFFAYSLMDTLMETL